MPVLCAANWSEGRNEVTLGDLRWSLRGGNCTVHYDGSDFDHNRIVTAFSGEPRDVETTLFKLASIAFDAIDMRKHKGVHPRIGALDVCPFIVLKNSMELSAAIEWSNRIAFGIAEKYSLPIFLYEKSETGKHARDLPTLRKGEFEGLMGRKLEPDYGPNTANPWLGATVMGVRDWLIAANVNLGDPDPAQAKQIAKEIRSLRETDARFRGVRALGFPLPSRSQSQVSLNLTKPDETSFDPIYEWISERAPVVGAELIGVIRERDLRGATHLSAMPEQVLEG